MDPTNSSLKEAFDLGMELPEDDPDILAGNLLYGDPLWPKEDGKFPFKEFARDYFNKMQNTSVEIMRLIALGLGENEDIFDDMFTPKPLSTLRFLHYPPREGRFTLKNNHSRERRRVSSRESLVWICTRNRYV